MQTCCFISLPLSFPPGMLVSFLIIIAKILEKSNLRQEDCFVSFFEGVQSAKTGKGWGKQNEVVSTLIKQVAFFLILPGDLHLWGGATPAKVSLSTLTEKTASLTHPEGYHVAFCILSA